MLVTQERSRCGRRWATLAAGRFFPVSSLDGGGGRAGDSPLSLILFGEPFCEIESALADQSPVNVLPYEYLLRYYVHNSGIAQEVENPTPSGRAYTVGPRLRRQSG